MSAQRCNMSIVSIISDSFGRLCQNLPLSGTPIESISQNQGQYETAEAIHRQTLVREEKVLRKEHPDTLASVYCLAHLLSRRNEHDESTARYKRAFKWRALAWIRKPDMHVSIVCAACFTLLSLKRFTASNTGLGCRCCLGAGTNEPSLPVLVRDGLSNERRLGTQH